MTAELKAAQQEVHLAARTMTGVSADDLVQHLCRYLDDGAVVIGWSAQALSIGKRTDDSVVGADAAALDVAYWFGCRAFDGTNDARWVRQGATGVLVVVSELAGGADADVAVERVDAVVTGVRHLLFGERDATANGWATLSAANVGGLQVPDPGGTSRLAIEAVEYVVFDSDGNADVIDERLVRLVEG
jgi:CRISPR-associated protein (TIGR03984 family)